MLEVCVLFVTHNMMHDDSFIYRIARLEAMGWEQVARKGAQLGRLGLLSRPDCLEKWQEMVRMSNKDTWQALVKLRTSYRTKENKTKTSDRVFIPVLINIAQLKIPALANLLR